MVTETEATATTEPQSENVSTMFQAPKVLREAIELQAKEKNISVSRWLRDFLADNLGIVLPETVRRARTKKYATEEERKEAYKRKAETQRDVMRKLMERYAAEAGISGEAGIEEFAKQLGLLDDDDNQE